jgi:uracil-DNA glycosylase family 4
MLDAASYAEFKKELFLSNCTLCGLSQSRTQLVVDRGNSQARVLFVGEAPGEKEDLEGLAFVGRSGRLLDEMLRAQGFDTDRDALIANVVKCRPPKNRAPRPAEAQTCLPYLRKQIDLMRPKWMVFLGATAYRHLLPEKKNLVMAKEAGHFFSHPLYPGIRLMALYHPAFILRDPRKRSLMASHLRQFVEAWKQN